MKRIVSWFAVLVLTVSIIGVTDSVEVKAKKTKSLYASVRSNITSMKVSWEKKKVDYFEVYRANVTKRINKGEYTAKESSFKKIAKVSKKKKNYVDKKVKAGQYYAYVVYGYAKSKGKKVKTYTSYKEGKLVYDYAGMSKPRINQYVGDVNIDNDANFVVLHVDSYKGSTPAKYIVYRKADGESDFKQIEVESMGKMHDTNVLMYKDTSVEVHKKYQYKVRAYKMVNNKAYYSKYSQVYEVTPCNARAKLIVESLTEAGDGVEEFEIKIQSDKDNGLIELRNGDYPTENEYIYQKDATESVWMYSAKLLQYSEDGTNWQEVGDKKISIDAGATVYLKCKLVKLDEETSVIKYGANQGITSNLTFDAVTYYGPNKGTSYMGIDLLKGTGWAYQVVE